MLSAHPIDPLLIPDTRPFPSRPTPDPIDVSASPRLSDDDRSSTTQSDSPQESSSTVLPKSEQVPLAHFHSSSHCPYLFSSRFQGSLNSSLKDSFLLEIQT